MGAAAFLLHYANTPGKNDEGRQTFAEFRHQFRLAKELGDFRPTHCIQCLLSLRLYDTSCESCTRSWYIACLCKHQHTRAGLLFG